MELSAALSSWSEAGAVSVLRGLLNMDLNKSMAASDC
jgi:hypothetical protein